nr:SRPBCC family protein [Mycobacterium tuberculosis]
MPDPDGPSVTVTVEIDANPDLVYGLITDLPTLASLAEEVVAMQLRKGDDVRKGAVFVGSQRKRWTALDHDVHRYRRRSRSGFRFRCTVRHYSDFTLAIWHRRYRTRLSGYGEHLGPAAQLVPRSCPDGHRRQGSGERKHRAHSTHPAASQGPS